MREVQDGVIAPDDPRQIGDWMVLARLGAGGMGVVYLAERDGRRAAIKTIRADLEVDPTFRKRFGREAAAVASAKSERIARIIESDLDAVPAYIAFEYYDGPNLRDVVKQGGPLSSSALQSLAIGLAEGLEAIHLEGVVHRDIKPSNVIMTVRGPVIIDFGIAAYEASELTQLTTTGEPIGSPTWMSPEYITTGRAFEPGDVFGWAATIQYAATGHPPFGMGATQPLLYRITNVEPTPHNIPGPLGRLVTQALSKRPESRPSTGDILQALLPGEPQTGSTPRLRLPLPAPITAGHRMNIGTAPLPVAASADTVRLPPPPQPADLVPPLRPRSRRPLGWLIALILLLVGLVAVGPLAFMLLYSTSASSGEPGRVQQVFPDTPATPVPVRPVATPEWELAEPPAEPPGPWATFRALNERDRSALDDHRQLVEIYFDEQGNPFGDPAAISAEISQQLRVSRDAPLTIDDQLPFDADEQVAIEKLRISFELIEAYPDLIETAVDAATGQSAVDSSAAVTSRLNEILVESSTQSGLDGLGAAAPALATLEGDLAELADGDHTELSDPEVQAAFGRFVRSASDLIVTPRRN